MLVYNKYLTNLKFERVNDIADELHNVVSNAVY